MSHKISDSTVHQYRKPPSETTVSRASAMQQNIRDVLGSNHETFLQGSYKNDTAISDLNDVDIVAVRKNIFSGTFSGVPVSNTVYWDQIFSEIEEKLDSSPLYRGKHKRGDKCIKLTGSIDVDIVPAVKVTTELEDPIAVFSFREGRERLNHPRVHFENGKNKNDRTEGHYKPIVRLMKNWTCAHFSDPRIAPSFCVECMVHAVPDNLFSSDHAFSFAQVGLDIVRKINNPIAPVLNVAGTKNIFNEWPNKVESFLHKGI